jgi:hypothetical protein
VLAVVLVVAVAVVPTAGAASASRVDDPPASGALLSATADAYAMRVEYDLPVPAGTGTVGHVSATAQRSPSVETSHGLAAAPSELDPVVGGKYADPQGSGHPVNKLPQVECHHPAENPTSIFRFPTGTNEQTAGVPATSYAYANCTSGPAVDVRAHVGDPSAPTPTDGEGAAIVASKGSIHPDHGVLTAVASSSASGITLGGGVVRIGSVSASGESVTAGTPGTARSVADVLLSDIQVAGLTFSLAFTESTVTLSSGGASVPIDDAAAQAVITAANAALAPSGCTLTVGKDPADYPQGFLFARPQPDLGVRDDGSLAASYRGGLLVVCDIPDNPVAQATQFSPERFQALVGFVYTSVAAGDDVGGFGLADLGGQGGSAAALAGDAFAAGATPAPAFVPGGATGELAPQATSAPGGTGDARSAEDVTSVFTSFFEPLPAGARWALALASIVLWAWLTHLALTRLLGIGARDEGAAS